MLRLDTGGGTLGIICIATLGMLAVVWFIAEVAAPIVRYLMPEVAL